ncbi:MAG: hypothetical protein RBR40_03130 [Tenuifilaceae bacterium]|nr:hypothetical protein [Tenuifilaceae bacterium]
MTSPFTLKLTILLALVTIMSTSYAQRITSFSTEPEFFPIELESITKSQVQKEDDNLLNKFKLFWSSDTISLEQKEQIIAISNLLLAKSAVNLSHFFTFTKTIMLYSESKKFQDEFNTWLKGLYEFAKTDNRSISWLSSFLDNSLSLFTRGVFAKNPAFEWKVSNNNFNYSFNTTLTLKFNDANLICQNRTDSIAIQSTQGEYFPLKNEIKGKGGKVTWIRSRFPENEIFATLSNYTVNTTRNQYEADSVLFTNLDYFDHPSLGKLTDKITGASNPANVAYPEFYTYDQRHKIENFFDGVSFDGGYYMLGSQFIGNGTKDNPAIIEIKRNNQDFLRVEAKTYIFLRTTVMSDYARIRFQLGTDSLYHTGLGFLYNDQKKLVTIAPTNMLTTQSPILSTYHNFSITFGQLQWQLGEEELNFSAPMGSSQSRAIFESNNFFNEEIFDQIMGRDEQHPLFAVANFTSKIKSKEFKVEQFSQYLRKSNDQVRIEIMRLAMQGYLLYEFETGDVYVLSKLYDAIRAKGKFIDYDVLKFSSFVESGNNAKLNLNTLEMAIRGVENVSISDSQNVFLYPTRNELTLKKNRNFEFNGKVEAGMFVFYGNEFNFDYENFRINSELIDSLNLKYQTNDIDFFGKRVLNRVTSSLKVISGEVLIDKPFNKSGLVKNKEYPIFNSKGNSYVYYDAKSIYNGVYDREKFYFEVTPFTFYSLNNFEVEDMHFTGVFYSAEIFAPIKDTLILRPDNSLGFKRTFPPDGFAIYKGKGRFYNQIDLSNQGLKGKGSFSYISSTTASNAIDFFPDSLLTKSTEFAIAQQISGIEFPSVQGKEHTVKWYPYKDILYANKGTQPFIMYNSEANLAGNLTLTPLGLIGNGLLDMHKARLTSSSYNFNALDFNSPKANSEFNVAGSDELAFIAPEVKAWVSFEARKGEFYKLGESISADLPPMMYKSHIDNFIWNIDNNELNISTPSTQQTVENNNFYISGMPQNESIPNGSVFYSYYQNEDSLYFFSPKVNYNMQKPYVKADSVEYLLIADAIINPYKQKIEIDAKKRIIPLEESLITANRTERYHNFYDANVTVTGRKRYAASGTIDYVDENDSIQPIKLKEIKIDPQGNTYAQTSLTEPDSFKLSPFFGYIGDLEIFAKEKFWTYQGGASPLHGCSQVKSSNVYFKSAIDPSNIFIPVAELPRNLNQNILINGSVVTVDSIHMYPALLSGRKDHTDRSLVKADGFIHFNKQRGRFLLGSKEKIQNPDTTGNLISLSKDFCMLISEGEIELPINLGQIKHISSGSATHLVADSMLNLDVVLALNFHFNQLSLEAMANDILLYKELANSDQSRKIFKNYLYQQASPEDAKTAVNQISLFGAMTQLPKGLESTITFNELKMYWDQKNTSFVSKDKIGIGTIGGIQVNKKVNGFVEIIKRNTGDWMMIYIELSPDKYYVFYYTRGAMQVSSHNSLFTDPINSMKSRARRVRVKAGQIPFNFVVGTRRELQRAQDRYNVLTGKAVEQNNENEENTEPQRQLRNKENESLETEKEEVSSTENNEENSKTEKTEEEI